MSELITVQASASKLGLPHLARTLQELTSRADTESMSYLDFLGLVLEEELAVRDERRFRTGLRLSKLPHHKTLDDYDFSFQPDLDPAKSATSPPSRSHKPAPTWVLDRNVVANESGKRAARASGGWALLLASRRKWRERSVLRPPSVRMVLVVRSTGLLRRRHRCRTRQAVRSR